MSFQLHDLPRKRTALKVAQHFPTNSQSTSKCGCAFSVGLGLNGVFVWFCLTILLLFQGTYNLETSPAKDKVDRENNAIIVHSQNNRVDLDRQTDTEKETAEWDRQTESVQIGGIQNGTVDLDEQKVNGELPGVHNGSVHLDEQTGTVEVGGIPNGTVDLDLQTSDTVEVSDIPKAQSRLERLLEAAAAETEGDGQTDRHIVGLERQKEGVEVKEELIVVESSAGLVSLFISTKYGNPQITVPRGI